jgi:hypothetical protein
MKFPHVVGDYEILQPTRSGVTYYVALRRRDTHVYLSSHSGKTVSQAVAAAKQKIAVLRSAVKY